MDPKWVDVFPIEPGDTATSHVHGHATEVKRRKNEWKWYPLNHGKQQVQSRFVVLPLRHWSLQCSGNPQKMGEFGPWQSAKHLPKSASEFHGKPEKKCPSQKSFAMTARFWVSNRFRFPRMSSYISNTKRLAVEVFCSGLELARYIVDMKGVILKDSKCWTVHDYHIYCCVKHEIHCIIYRICVWYWYM